MGHRLSRTPDRSSKAWEWEDRTALLVGHPKAQRGLRGAYCNRIYAVQYVVRGSLAMLQIRRHDRGKDFPWRDLQRIKNELVGPEREAVQVFPRESEVVDAANMAHLWIIPEGVRWPMTFQAFVGAGFGGEP